jgi:hypothetical protein
MKITKVESMSALKLWVRGSLAAVAQKCENNATTGFWCSQNNTKQTLWFHLNVVLKTAL